ncbi:MAG: histidinol-phosphatase [Rickettsiales bacterium]|nr:histidinol-phosphatase [Rickettsiales bacterium]
MIDKKISDLAAFANHLADLSEPIARKYFRTPNGEIIKDDQSPVTLADREIEEIIRAEIAKKFPDHGIIGEEYGISNPDSDYQWILDPIDGTASFIIGRPTFGTLIALAYKGIPQIGIINQPITNERWFGVIGDGAWLNGKPIKSRDCGEISNAIISTTSQFFFDESDLQKFQKLALQAKYQRFGGVVYGGDCYAYALLASGFLDIIIEPSLKVYDYAALIPIIKMAGGFVGDWEGNEIKLESDGRLIACGSEALYRKVIALIK